jgi:hypothetical protein
MSVLTHAHAVSHAKTDPAPWLRHAVRDVLLQSEGYKVLQPEQRQSLAKAMVNVSAMAAELISHENEAQKALAARKTPLAKAQNAPDFAAAADRVASTTRNVLNAVSFPRFVTDLINGVFRAMLDSNSQQMQQYVQLLNSVSASAEGFERTQFSANYIRSWLADRFPENIEYQAPEVEEEPNGMFTPGPEEEAATGLLRLRSGASMPSEDAIRASLGVGPEESIEASNPEQLVPFARRQIARQRQQMLSTMVMMGMQRIVVESGRINASMRFHVDTRSAANQDRGNQFGMQNRVKGGASFGVGPWGASAEVENTISYITTERTQTTEEINTDLDLNSSVELVFRSDYIPLNRMAAQANADRIRSNSLNPDAEIEAARTERTTRTNAQRETEAARRGVVDSSVARVNTPPPATQAVPPVAAVTPVRTPPVAPTVPPVVSPAPSAAPAAVVAPARTPPVAPPPATGIGTGIGSVIGGVVGAAVGGAVGGPVGAPIGQIIGSAIGAPVGGAVEGAIGNAIAR